MVVHSTFRRLISDTITPTTTTETDNGRKQQEKKKTMYTQTNKWIFQNSLPSESIESIRMSSSRFHWITRMKATQNSHTTIVFLFIHRLVQLLSMHVMFIWRFVFTVYTLSHKHTCARALRDELKSRYTPYMCFLMFLPFIHFSYSISTINK